MSEKQTMKLTTKLFISESRIIKTNTLIYKFNYQIKKENTSAKFLSNYFVVNSEEFNTFFNFIKKLSNNNPIMINLKINKELTESQKKLYPSYARNEHLTLKEKELDIRSIVVSPPHGGLPVFLSMGVDWKLVCLNSIEIPNEIIQ